MKLIRTIVRLKSICACDDFRQERLAEGEGGQARLRRRSERWASRQAAAERCHAVRSGARYAGLASCCAAQRCAACRPPQAEVVMQYPAWLLLTFHRSRWSCSTLPSCCSPSTGPGGHAVPCLAAAHLPQAQVVMQHAGGVALHARHVGAIGGGGAKHCGSGGGGARVRRG